MSSLALAKDVDVGAILLRAVGSKTARGGTRVDQRITDGTLERTMDGASTLTLVLDDHDRALLRSGVFDKQLDVQLDGLWWRLVKVTKSADMLTLTFEDRAVSLLRAITTPRKAARSSMTRAEFALSIVREVKTGGGIPFYSPQLHVRQPIATASQQTSATDKTATVQQGLASDASLTVKGAPASSGQRQTGERVLSVAASLSAGPRATLALLEACIVESELQNLSYGDASSTGILQVLASTAQSMGIDPRDVEACCNAFLSRGFTGRGGAIVLAAKNPSWTTGQVAQGVQGSAYPTRYDQWAKEAQTWLDAFGGVAGGGSISTSATVTQLPYQFQRGGTDGSVEDSWSCLQRLAQEVEWRCFMRDGVCYFVSDETLVKARPIATLDENTLGIDGIDFDVDNGKPASTATISARAMRHGFPPGAVVVLENCGPANGRWLVQDASRGVFDAAATITLKRVTQPLPEPPNETTTESSSSGLNLGIDASSLTGGLGGTDAPNDSVARAYSAALAIDGKRYPYIWGGGHARAGTPDGGTGRDPGVGFDCSGSTVAVLAAAALGFTIGGPVDVSGTIASRWGQQGEGQYLTVWANDIHVWMEFKTNRGDQHFGTGDWGKGWGGAGFNPQMHPKSGFTPRHWPGT